MYVERVYKNLSIQLFHGYLGISQNCCPDIEEMISELLLETNSPRTTVQNVIPDTKGQQFWLLPK